MDCLKPEEITSAVGRDGYDEQQLANDNSDPSTESEKDSVKHYNPREDTPTSNELLRRERIESLVVHNRRKAGRCAFLRDSHPHARRATLS